MRHVLASTYAVAPCIMSICFCMCVHAIKKHICLRKGDVLHSLVCWKRILTNENQVWKDEPWILSSSSTWSCQSLNYLEISWWPSIIIMLWPIYTCIGIKYKGACVYIYIYIEWWSVLQKYCMWCYYTVKMRRKLKSVLLFVHKLGFTAILVWFKLSHVHRLGWVASMLWVIVQENWFINMTCQCMYEFHNISRCSYMYVVWFL